MQRTPAPHVRFTHARRCGARSKDARVRPRATVCSPRTLRYGRTEWPEWANVCRMRHGKARPTTSAQFQDGVSVSFVHAPSSACMKAYLATAKTSSADGAKAAGTAHAARHEFFKSGNGRRRSVLCVPSCMPFVARCKSRCCMLHVTLQSRCCMLHVTLQSRCCMLHVTLQSRCCMLHVALQ